MLNDMLNKMPNATIAASAAITPQLLKDHGITADEYARIEAALGRVPTLTELGIYSVMWSEHCSYKSSRVHLKRLPTTSARVVQGPGENAGIIDIGEGWACAFKIESHNHPSFIEPFQGAATGVGGILRDIFTMGARPVAVMDSLRFGPVSADGVGHRKVDETTIHRNHSILDGVVRGVASYGNCFGVPNVGGEVKFEYCYSGNPLVNAFALGLVKIDEIFYAKAAGVGNPVIYVGSKTGRDGIHGATMASEEFSEGSEAKRPNVQVGDPFMEKLLLEACLEAMQTGAIVGIQDMGAAGLTCSTCEMGARGEVGIEIDLDKVPQRETGMNAYEIMLSESQERMLLVAEKGREEEVFAVFRKWGLDAVTVGVVAAAPRLKVFEHGQLVADIPNTSLTDDAPLYHRPVGTWQPPVPHDIPANIQLTASGDQTSALYRMLAASNISSKRFVWQQYDSMVQTNTAEGPGGGDAGVIRIKGTNRGLAMALDGNGRWCYLDPSLGAKHAVAEACRNVVCSGALPVAATNCLNFGNPEKPEIMGQLSAAIDGMSEACVALDTPITGGNVSLYNETLGEGIYPTPVMGIVGIIEDLNHLTHMHFTQSGRAVLLLSASTPADSATAVREFGSSDYAKEVLGTLWGTPPALDLASEVRLQRCLLQLIQSQVLDSAHDCTEGGIAVALAECGFRYGVGARVNLASNGKPLEVTLFGETASRIVLSCDQINVPRIQQVGVEYGLSVTVLGETVPDTLEISVEGTVAVAADVSGLRDRFEAALPQALAADSALVAGD